MPSPNSVFTEIVTSTLRHHPSDISDNVTDNNALLLYLKKHGKIKYVSGGYELVQNIEYDLLNYQRYSGSQVLDISTKPLFTSANFAWQQAAVMVTSTGLESRVQNAGEEAMFDLVEERMSNAKKSAANNQSVDIYSNGALANQIGGLALLIQTNGQGTVGGIDSSVAANAFWRNDFLESGTPAANQTFLNEWNALYYRLCRGTTKPNLIVASHDFYGFIESTIQEKQRYMSDEKAGIGFPSFKYKGIEVIFDSNVNFLTTAERAYFLNLDNIKFIVHKGTNWTTMERRFSMNQDADVVPIFWAGNLVINNRRNQGVLFD